MSSLSVFESTRLFFFPKFTFNVLLIYDNLISVNGHHFLYISLFVNLLLFFSELIFCIYSVDASFHNNNSVGYNSADGD